MTTTRIKVNRAGVAKALFWIVAGVSLYFTATLNTQPWINGVGEFFASKITVLPGLGILSQIPFVGGWFTMLAGALGMIIGLCLWGWLQIVQVVPLLAEEFACPEWLEELRGYRTLAYAVEVVVCALFFPPFDYGWDLAMLPHIIGDWSAVDWQNVAVMVTTILAFELTVYFLLKFKRGMDRSFAYQQRAYRTAQAAQQQQSKQGK